MADAPPFLTARVLDRDGIRHGFFGRAGGTSSGIYASLNCGLGSSDERESVLENRRRAAAALPAKALVTVYQCHSADVRVVAEPWPGEPPRTDAMVSVRPGIALGILAADCAPVLFADTAAGVIGAAHAGWRGALAGILEKSIGAMEMLGAQRHRIAAAIGPTIGRESYEVGPEFEALFREAAATNAQFFRPAEKPSHFLFDLAGFARHRLRDAGVQQIEVLEHCTYRDQDGYFSYRRSVHRGEADYGRNLSAIVLHD